LCNLTDMGKMPGCPGPFKQAHVEEPPEPVDSDEYHETVSAQFADYQIQITDLVSKFEQREQRERIYARDIQQQQQQEEAIQEEEHAYILEALKRLENYQ